MSATIRAITYFTMAGVVLTFLFLQPAEAMDTAAAPAAPIPIQILSAKKIFIANAGGDEMAENDPQFTGGPDRAYNQFYAATKAWGHFEIVAVPSDADLLLEIRQEVLALNLGRSGGYTPLLHLEIRDPRTNALLWAFHVHFEFWLGQSNSDRNFDQAFNRLMSDFRALMARGSTQAGNTSPQ